MTKCGTVWLSCLLVACGGTSPAERTTPTANDPEPVLLDGRTGQPITFEEAIARSGSARVVYVGEEHGNAHDHDLQRRVYEALAAQGRVGLGLEMFQRPFQSVADDYAHGRIDEAALLAGVEWETRWGGDFADYRGSVNAAREHAFAIVALNAPKELTRAVGREGLESLSEDLRAQLPELVLDNAAHRDLVQGALREHASMTEARLARLYAAQVIWDESMAQSVAEAFERDPEMSQIVVLAGRMHVEGGLGIPSRAVRRGVSPHVIFLPVSLDEAQSFRDEQSSDAASRADFLWVRASE